MVALDGLRGVAILLVLGAHFSADLDATGATIAPAVRAAGAGWVGVDLFFVLSGFLITGILVDTRGDPAYYRNFYARRIVRIFPLYYGMLAVALILAPTLGWPGTRDAIGRAQPYYWLYAVNVLILITGSMRPLAHLWSLAVEEHFYLAWPLVTGVVSRRGLIAASVGLAAIAPMTRIIMRGYFSPIAIYTFTPCRMDSLAIGALGALVSRSPGARSGARRASAALAIALAAAIGGLALAKGGLPQFDRDVQAWGYTALAALFGCVVTLVAPITRGRGGWVGSILCSAVPRAFGKYSYGSYVLHPFVMGALARLVPSHRPGASWGIPSLGIATYVLAGILITQATAYASWHLFERHFLRLKGYFEYRGVPAGPRG